MGIISSNAEMGASGMCLSTGLTSIAAHSKENAGIAAVCNLAAVYIERKYSHTDIKTPSLPFIRLYWRRWGPCR